MRSFDIRAVYPVRYQRNQSDRLREVATHADSKQQPKNPAGWIIDLRNNDGGNMWPMLAAIGPVIGGGTLGFFQSKAGAVPWFYEHGSVGVIMQTGKSINMTVDNKVAAL